MSGEQLGENSEGHGTFGLCDGMCMFMPWV